VHTTIGIQELALLRFIAERGPVTVGEVAETYGRERGLSRTTCLTMMQRLREKRRLARRKSGGVFVYSSRESAGELMQGLVRQFVERSLDGSVTPFVQYLSADARVSASELRELEALVRKLRDRNNAGEDA
jgi:predicted transcriptional regulator